MKRIILFIGLLLYSLASFGADCSFGDKGSVKLISWTGNCENGIASGDGRAVFLDVNTGNEITVVGRIESNQKNNTSGFTGLMYLDKKMKPDGHLLQLAASSRASTGWDFDYDENDKSKQMSFIIPDLYIYKPSRNSRFIRYFTSVNSQTYSFDEVLEKLLNHLSNKNTPSIQKDKFLSILFEEDYKKEQVAKELMRDDPPVIGVTLSLGGASSDGVKPKRKPKKK